MTNSSSLRCPITGITHSSLHLSQHLSSSLGIINNVHPLLMLSRKQSKSILANSNVVFESTNEEINLISIGFLIASSSSQSIQENKNNNHYRKSDFLILTSQLTTKFIQESGWGKLSNSSILSAGDILFTHLNEPINSNNKTKPLRSYLPEKINLSDSNIQNVPSIIIEALRERSQKVETIIKINEEKLITSLMNDRDHHLSANSKSREFIPLRAINYILSLLTESLKTPLPKEIKEFYTSILSSPSLPIGVTISDLKNFITLLDATDSTASVKFITLNLLDKKLSKLSNTNFLLSLGLDDDDDTTSPSGLSNYQLTSFLSELSNVRNTKPEFAITTKTSDSSDSLDDIFNNNNNNKVSLTKEELLNKIKSIQSNLNSKHAKN